MKLTLLSYNGISPKFSRESCFIAESATLCGGVTLEDGCSIWFGAVLRAEVAPISFGKGSNVQDNSVIHTDLGFPVKVGEEVTVGHAAVIHGATVGSNCLIGMRSTLLNGSRVGDNCIVAAGSLITQNTEIPDNTLAMGFPAVVRRKLTQEEIQAIGLNAKHYSNFGREYLKAKRGRA